MRTRPSTLFTSESSSGRVNTWRKVMEKRLDVHVCENVILLCNSCNARTRVVAE